VINIMGRIYMDYVECPFKAIDRELEKIKKQTKIIFVDFHGEATSEKCAIAYYLDGRASCVVGTHTHVQTADERILPEGTAFISDVGMTGPADGVIGVTKDIVIKRFKTQVPERFEAAKGRAQFSAVVCEIDDASGRATNIERIYLLSTSES